MSNNDITEHLLDTQLAFDSVAADYDGARGNNASIRAMRTEMWRWLDATFQVPGQLLDLGCGTGLDAIRMAAMGHRITATDWSGAMVARTSARADSTGLSGRVQALTIGAHELEQLGTPEFYDGAYSNLGPLNCVPSLAPVARECARLLKPGGSLVFTVIGRICPWEVAHYARRCRWSRLRIRYARGIVPVGMNGRTIWTRYYTPREFYQPFADRFILQHFRALCLFVPPPYISWITERHPRCYQALWRLDRRLGGWPLLRGMGDHFLMVMTRR